MARGNPNGRGNHTAHRRSGAPAGATGSTTAALPQRAPRGRGAIGVRPQAAAPAPVSPAPTSGIGAIVSGPYTLSAEENAEATRLAGEWDAAVDAAIDRAMREKLNRLIDIQSQPRERTIGFRPRGTDGGGHAGDTTRQATDLLEMAALSASGDLEMRRGTSDYLRKAREHQIQHIARLEEAIAAPRKRTSHEMWKATGGRVKSTDVAAHARLLAEAQRTLTKIKDHEAGYIFGGMNTVREAERLTERHSHASRLANSEFGRLLRDGELAVAYRFATLVSKRSDIPRLEGTLAMEGIEENMANAARIARALAAAEPNETHKPLRDLQSATDAHFANLLAAREAGEVRHRRYRTEGPHLTAAVTADAVHRVAHAMLRDLDEYRTSTMSMRHGAKVRVPATVDALRELREQKMGTPVWDRLVLSDRPATRAGAKRSVWVEAHMSVRVGEQDIDLIAEAHIGTTMYRTPSSQNAWLQERAAELHAKDVILNLPVVQEPERVAGQGQPRIEPREDPGDGPRPPGRDRLTDLIGKDECRHENAQWLPANGGRHIHDTARLDCPTCYRPRVAVAPLHRLPTDHPVRREVFDGKRSYRHEAGSPNLTNEQRYLMRERYHAALRDDDRPVQSIEQLTARDGLVDLDPAAYAIGTPGPLEKTPPRRPVRSIADAMRRRGR